MFPLSNHRSLRRNNLDVEFQLRVESLFVGVTVTINEVGNIRNRKIVSAEKPLVDFHLALVADLPFRVEINLGRFRRGFVIHDVEFVLTVQPNIVHSAPNEKIGRAMEKLDALRPGIPPFFQFVVGIRHRVDFIFFISG